MLRNFPAALVLLASTLALAWAGSSAQAPSKKDPAPLAFSHKQHVSQYWSSRKAKDEGRALRSGEYARDCQGCHDYRTDVPASQLKNPADSCERCHDPDRFFKSAATQSIDTSRASVDPAQEEQRFFKHSQHRKNSKTAQPLDCAECHYQDTGTATKPDWEITFPSGNFENKAFCTSCHNKDDPEVRESFNAGLTRESKRLAATREGPLVFSHAAHMRPEELAGGKPEKCNQCHASMKDAKPDSLAEVQFDTNACNECHNGIEFAASSKLENGEPYQVESPTDGVFSHAQHLKPHSGNKDIAPIGEESCLRCHEFESTARRKEQLGVRSFALKPFLSGANGKTVFDGCLQCHKEVKVPDHGNVDACAQCHVVEPGSLTQFSKLATNRPRDRVETQNPASFTFERQSHKFISKESSKDAPANCADCHKAKLDAQPSRINEKPFDHATHLPKGFAQLRGAEANAQCAKCHAPVAGSGTLKDLKTIYELASCVDCHGKTPPTPIFEKTPRTSVFRFDHEQHVGKRDKSGRIVECADCHLSDRPASPIVLRDKIADCTLCHAHPPKAEGKINRFELATVQACSKCHAVGVPEKGRPVAVARARVVMERGGYQKHEGTDRCDKCHIVDEALVLDSNSKRRSDLSSNAFTITPPAGKSQMETPHDARIAKNKARDADEAAVMLFFHNEISCVECHYARPEKCDDVTASNAAKKSTSPWVKELLSDSQWRRKSRAGRGDFLGGAGTNYPSGFPGLDPARKP